MYYLGLDTTNKYLIVTIFNDDDVLYFYQDKSFRNVSENANYIIDTAFNEVGIKPADLKGVVVTRGPGSFTGVRIGLSIAKVLTMILDIPLYTLSSMQFYSGISSIPVVLDARSKKVYYGIYEEGNIISEAMIAIDELENLSEVYGDGSLISLSDNYQGLDNNFLLLKNFWQEESYFDAVPTYLKSNL